MRGGRRQGAGRPKGSRNKRTVAVEQAMQVVAEKLKHSVPDAFEGDGVAFLQSVYRDPSFPVALRLDAAAKAARFERPMLAATAIDASLTITAAEAEERRLTRERMLAELQAFAIPEPLETTRTHSEEKSERPNSVPKEQRYTGVDYRPPPDRW